MSVQVSNLSFGYPGQPEVLKDISFTIPEGILVSLLGPNGAGKSTLMKCMLGLMRHYRGDIVLDGVDIRNLTPKQMARKTAYIPQSAEGVFNYTVEEMVLMGTTSLLSGLNSPGKKEEETVLSALRKLHIDHLRYRRYMNLSGGERQLVMIARALAQNTRILYMDEPAANLDYGNQIRVMEEIRSLIREGYTVFQTTHNPDQAFLYSDRIMALAEGKIIAYGTPQEVITPDLIRRLYHIETEIERLHDDRIRICIPASVLEGVKTDEQRVN